MIVRRSNVTYLVIGLTDSEMLAHVQVLREDLIFLGVNHGEGVDRDQDFITVAVHSYRVVEILIFIVRSELDINVLSDTRGYHPLFVVLNLKIGGRGRQDVKALRSG